MCNPPKKLSDQRNRFNARLRLRRKRQRDQLAQAIRNHELSNTPPSTLQPVPGALLQVHRPTDTRSTRQPNRPKPRIQLTSSRNQPPPPTRHIVELCRRHKASNWVRSHLLDLAGQAIPVNSRSSRCSFSHSSTSDFRYLTWPPSLNPTGPTPR